MTLTAKLGKAYTDSEIAFVKSEIETWGGSRKSYAKACLSGFYRDGAVIVIGKKDGELVAIANLISGQGWRDLPDGKYIFVKSLASKRKGNGQAMLEKIKGIAEQDSIGVALIADHNSVCFYQAAGMTQVPETQTFYYKASE